MAISVEEAYERGDRALSPHADKSPEEMRDAAEAYIGELLGIDHEDWKHGAAHEVLGLILVGTPPSPPCRLSSPPSPPASSGSVSAKRPDRPLDQRGQRTDVCPTCGAERAELPPEIVADRFYCSRCERATVGPNTTPPPPPPPEQTGLFSVSDIGREPAGEDRPPLDEYDSYPMPEDEG